MSVCFENIGLTFLKMFQVFEFFLCLVTVYFTMCMKFLCLYLYELYMFLKPVYLYNFCKGKELVFSKHVIFIVHN